MQIVKRRKPIPEVPEAPPRAWKVAQLAAVLATRHPFIAVEGCTDLPQERTKTQRRHVHQAPPDLEDFYFSLVIRAEELLRMAEKKRGEICAHELFDPERKYSIREIVTIFRMYNWVGLEGPTSVRRLITKCLDDLDALVKRPTRDADGASSSLRDQIRGDIQSLVDDGRALGGSAIRRVDAYSIFKKCVENELNLDQLTRLREKLLNVAAKS